MIPFERSWPYETMGNDVYLAECPFCGTRNIQLPMRVRELKEIREGKKKLLVFPCCFNRVKIVDTDSDYLLSDEPMRNRRS